MISPEDLIRWFALGYWILMLIVVFVICLLAKLVMPKGHKLWVAIVLSLGAMAAFIVPIAKIGLKENQEQAQKREKYLPAKAEFDKRCQSAGIKVYRTVEDVEGVTLLNVWPREKKYFDQMWEYAGLPTAYGDDLYIRSFIKWRNWDYQINDFDVDSRSFILSEESIPFRTNPNKDPRFKYINGYQYVDVLQNEQYIRYQYKDLYRLTELTTKPVKKPSRYTIEFENPVVPQDRAMWLATTKAIIKDSHTNEVLAESTWYSFHHRQGKPKYDTTGIWDRAEICPGIANMQDGPIQYFVVKVLKPKQLIQEHDNDQHPNQ